MFAYTNERHLVVTNALKYAKLMGKKPKASHEELEKMIKNKIFSSVEDFSTYFDMRDNNDTTA